MVGNRGWEIEQETDGSLERRYWFTAVGIVLAADFVISYDYHALQNEEYIGEEDFYLFTGLLIGGGIGIIISRLILAAISGEPKSRRFDHFFGAIVIGPPLTFFFLLMSDDNLICFFPAVVFGAVLGPYLLKLFRLIPPNRFIPRWLGILIGGMIIFGIPMISLGIMAEQGSYLIVGLIGLIILVSFIVYEEGRKEPEKLFYPVPTALIILVTILTTGLPISAILLLTIIDSLVTSLLVGGLVGVLSAIVMNASARKAGQPSYVVAHLLGVGFAFLGIAFGLIIWAIIDISINGFGYFG